MPSQLSARHLRSSHPILSHLIVLDCPECAGPRGFEEPPCADEHRPCPELSCVACGTALFVGASSSAVAPEVVLARTA